MNYEQQGLLTASEGMRCEYCAKVVRMGAMLPVAGSEEYVRTVLDGFCCVVERGRFEEGDVVVYCLNETALNKDFLSVNNLYEWGEYERNANAAEVTALLAAGRRSEAHALTGKYGRYGRVRMSRVEDCLSFGCVFATEALERWKPALKGLDWAGYLYVDDNGYEHSYNFDTVDGELFVRAFEPRVKASWRGLSSRSKRARHVEFDRLVEGQFAFHYDTAQLRDNIWRLRPETQVCITTKVHGTSVIVGNLLTRRPKPADRVQQWMRDLICCEIERVRHCEARFPWERERQRREEERLRALMPMPYAKEYGPVYSSRAVVKNQYLRDSLGPGFYGVDIWSEYGELIYPYLRPGMTVYGEICGYVTGRDLMIMAEYDYGCAVGENFMMPYRITETDRRGNRREWSVEEVVTWTEALRTKVPELAQRLQPIPVLYSGTLGQLYPDLLSAAQWHAEVLQRLAADRDLLGMEEAEPLCRNEVPREGVVLRIVGDPESEAFKLKSNAFMERESRLMDQEEAQTTRNEK